MLPGGSKTRSARQEGYFEKQFTRIMEAESYSDPVKRRRQDRLKQSSLNLGHAFVPSSGEKLAYVHPHFKYFALGGCRKFMNEGACSAFMELLRQEFEATVANGGRLRIRE